MRTVKEQQLTNLTYITFTYFPCDSVHGNSGLCRWSLVRSSDLTTKLAPDPDHGWTAREADPRQHDGVRD